MKLSIQVSRFIITGVSAVLIDFGTYFLLINIIGYDLAKTISFVFGSVFSFIFNKLWTFEKKVFLFSEVIKFSILYSFTLILNVFVNKIILLIDYSFLILAFLMATFVSASVNFLGQKFIVFKTENY
jgi:putative flippase GtrA